MDNVSLKEEVSTILADILGEKIINKNTSILNTENWDSIAHLHIIMSLERKFSLSVKPQEASELIDYEKIVEFVLLKSRGRKHA